MNKKIIIFSFIALVIVLVVGYFLKTQVFNLGSKTVTGQAEISTMNPTTIKTLAKPEMMIDKNKMYSGVLHTSDGDITIELNAKATPITVNNFVYLSKNNFYNDTIFHRVIKGFMIQGGDPKSDGTGGPGYQFDDEPITGEYVRGTVAMANSGKNTNGSQFFIMHKDNFNLPKNYVIFGKVILGIEVVDKIAEAPVETTGSGEESKPINPVSLTSVEVIEK